MSSRLKVVVMDSNGGIIDYRMQAIKERVRIWYPEIKFSGNRAKDLALAKEALLGEGIFLFTWREAKEARGREELVKKLQRALRVAKTRITARRVVRAVEKELSGEAGGNGSGLEDWISELARNSGVDSTPEPMPDMFRDSEPVEDYGLSWEPTRER